MSFGRISVMADLFIQAIEPPKAPTGRFGPRLWIRRLVILSDPNTIIRDVSLKPGLNIIWSPDMASGEGKAIAHGSGKTTFCRLIRACLGEPSFASESQSRRIMSKLPNGKVACEVMIDGQCWVAVRALGLPGGDFAIEADRVEDALAQGRQEGDPVSIDAIIAATFLSKIVGAAPSDVGSDHVWDVLRAWLTRDQECRLSDILDWRSSRTQSRSRAQELSVASKLTMVRLALRALDADERAAAKRERELMAAAQAESRRQTYQQQLHLETLQKARQVLNVAEDVGLDDRIEQAGLISLAQKALSDAMRTELPKPPDVADIFGRLDALGKERAELVARQQQHINGAAAKRKEAEHLRSEANRGEIDITQGGIRVCPICRVSVDEVLAKGCGISLQSCDVVALRAAISAKQSKADNLDAEAVTAEQESNRVNALIEQLAPRQLVLEQESKSADDNNRAAQAAAQAVQDKVYKARRLLDDLRGLQVAEPAGTSTTSATRELETARANLEAGRSRAQAAIGTLEERYRGVMAAWLPEGVAGTIKLDGNGLRVDAEFSGRGEVSTAALDSLKIVAFDLAALHMAVEERAEIPAILIHDSPREADLDSQLYAGLFDLVHKWEQATDTPAFQYIVTTTTAPPKHLQTNLHVRITMSSTPPDQRLFTKDI
jgi:hypothetical protein